MSGAPHILVVDADQSHAEHLADLLASYRVHIAHNSEDALLMYDDFHLRTQVVVINTNTTDEHPDELIRDFKSISDIAEYIVIGEASDIDSTISVMKAGAFTFLPQPFTDETFIQLIDRCVEEIDVVEKLDESKSDISKNSTQIIPWIRYASEMQITSGKDPDPSLNVLLSYANDSNWEMVLGDNESAKVLIVEDELMYCDMISQFLSDSFDVHAAHSGEEALKVVSKFCPDVILLDMLLPDIPGQVLLKDIKEKCPYTQVIIVTAFEDIKIAVEAFRNGAIDYLNKPFLRQDIIAAVKDALKLKFKQQSFPNMCQKFIQTKLPENVRIDLFKSLIHFRHYREEVVTMMDLYYFFPDLTQTQIPSTSHLPRSVIHDDIQTFIHNLRHNIKSYSE